MPCCFLCRNLRPLRPSRWSAYNLFVLHFAFLHHVYACRLFCLLRPSRCSALNLHLFEHYVCVLAGVCAWLSPLVGVPIFCFTISFDTTCACLQDFSSGEALTLECACKGELAMRHRACAIEWSNFKGDLMCDICKHQIRNLPPIDPAILAAREEALRQRQPNFNVSSQ